LIDFTRAQGGIASTSDTISRRCCETPPPRRARGGGHVRANSPRAHVYTRRRYTKRHVDAYAAPKEQLSPERTDRTAPRHATNPRRCKRHHIPTTLHRNQRMSAPRRRDPLPTLARRCRDGSVVQWVSNNPSLELPATGTTPVYHCRGAHWNSAMSATWSDDHCVLGRPPYLARTSDSAGSSRRLSGARVSSV